MGRPEYRYTRSKTRRVQDEKSLYFIVPTYFSGSCVQRLRRSSIFPPFLLSKWQGWPILHDSENRGVFCHVAHDEMALSEVLFSDWQSENRCSNETKTY